jgi:hypothetical protein
MDQQVETCGVQSPTHSGRWKEEEHEAFLEGLHVYGREWTKVALEPFCFCFVFVVGFYIKLINDVLVRLVNTSKPGLQLRSEVMPRNIFPKYQSIGYNQYRVLRFTVLPPKNESLPIKTTRTKSI